MPDQSHAPTPLGPVVHTETAVSGTAPSAQHESSTKGMLRDAIQKVMEEIEHHEREAKKHTQKAVELRKDLRESFAFLQEKKGDAKPAKPAEEARTAEPKADEKPQRGAKKDAPAAKARKK